MGYDLGYAKGYLKGLEDGQKMKVPIDSYQFTIVIDYKTPTHTARMVKTINARSFEEAFTAINEEVSNDREAFLVSITRKL